MTKITLCTLFLLTIITYSVRTRREEGKSHDPPPTQITADNVPTDLKIATFNKFVLACSAPSMSLWNAFGLYISCFDSRKNSPWFSLHKYGARDFQETKDKRPNVSPWYTVKPGLPEELNGRAFERSTTTNQGFDLGHLTANGDFRAEEDKIKTFIVFNRAPQLASINRGFWRCIEDALRETTKELDASEVAILTLMAYSASSPSVQEQAGGAKSMIPDFFTKIVIAEISGRKELFCIIQQNKEYDSSKTMKNQVDKVYPRILPATECVLENVFQPHLELAADISRTETTFLDRFKEKLMKTPSEIRTIRCEVIQPICAEMRLFFFTIKQIYLKKVKRWVVVFDNKCNNQCNFPKAVASSYKITSQIISGSSQKQLQILNQRSVITKVIKNMKNKYADHVFRYLKLPRGHQYRGTIEGMCCYAEQGNPKAQDKSTGKMACAPKQGDSVMVNKCSTDAKSGTKSKCKGTGSSMTNTNRGEKPNISDFDNKSKKKH